MDDGFHHVPGFLSAAEVAGLIDAARDICREAPLGKPLPHEPRPVLRPSTTARICMSRAKRPIRMICANPRAACRPICGKARMRMRK